MAISIRGHCFGIETMQNRCYEHGGRLEICVKILDLLQEPRKDVTKSLDARHTKFYGRQTESVDGGQAKLIRARAGLA